MSESMRLNKFLAACGVASRRKVDAYIEAGRVQVNGETVTDFSTRITTTDIVSVDGEHVSLPKQHTIIAFYKPRGVVTTKGDAHAKQTLLDILPKDLHQLHPIGRLDKESEGLLLLTDDGDLTQQLTHPSFEKEKEYYVSTKNPLTTKQLKALAEGIDLEEGNTGKNTVEQLATHGFRIVLTQGWKRQIRRMVAAVGNDVTMLRRLRVGKLMLGVAPIEHLTTGKWKEIERSDILD